MSIWSKALGYGASAAGGARGMWGGFGDWAGRTAGGHLVRSAAIGGAIGAGLGGARGAMSDNGSFLGGAFKGAAMGAGLGLLAPSARAGINAFRMSPMKAGVGGWFAAGGRAAASQFMSDARMSSRFIGSTARKAYNGFRAMGR